MDILEQVRNATNGTHEWEIIPFSSHHGWEHYSWRCKKCEEVREHLPKEDLITEGCRCKGEDFVVQLMEEIERQRTTLKKAKDVLRHCKMFIVDNTGYHQTRAEEVADIAQDINAILEVNP